MLHLRIPSAALAASGFASASAGGVRTLTGNLSPIVGRATQALISMDHQGLILANLGLRRLPPQAR